MNFTRMCHRNVFLALLPQLYVFFDIYPPVPLTLHKGLAPFGATAPNNSPFFILKV